MVDGALLEFDGDLDVDGLLIRARTGTSAGLRLISGGDLIGLDVMRETPRSGLLVGASRGSTRLPPRTIVVPLRAETVAARAALWQAFAGTGPRAFTFQGHQHPAGEDGGKGIVHVVPETLVGPSTSAGTTTGFWHGEAVWVADDPRIYSLTETETTGVDDTMGGFEIANAGNWPAPFRFEVEGPFTDGRIRNIDTGAAWRWPDLVATSDQTLEVDFRLGTAWITEVGEDDISVWHLAETDGGGVPPDRLYIEPGGTSLGWAVDTGTDEATVYSRDCWA